jgi:IclR family mhp operon transcriptional activator
MAQAKVITVRGLERGLDLLRVIERRNAPTAADLHRETLLPKPTLTRLLRTLEQKGFIWRSQSDGCYRLSHQKHGSAQMPPAGERLASVSGPVLDELCEAVRWPSDVSVRNKTFMQLCETSRNRSYFTLNRLEIGYRINMLMSAPGRANLAWCSAREKGSILSQLKKDPGMGRDLLERPEALEAMLEATRERGYAVRDSSWGGDYSRPKSDFDDGLGAIAVPILVDRKVLGCVNLVWIGRLFTPEKIAASHVSRLQLAAHRIAGLASTSPRNWAAR